MASIGHILFFVSLLCYSRAGGPEFRSLYLRKSNFNVHCTVDVRVLNKDGKSVPYYIISNAQVLYDQLKLGLYDDEEFLLQSLNGKQQDNHLVLVIEKLQDLLIFRGSSITDTVLQDGECFMHIFIANTEELECTYIANITEYSDMFTVKQLEWTEFEDRHVMVGDVSLEFCSSVQLKSQEFYPEKSQDAYIFQFEHSFEIYEWNDENQELNRLQLKVKNFSKNIIACQWEEGSFKLNTQAFYRISHGPKLLEDLLQIATQALTPQNSLNFRRVQSWFPPPQPLGHNKRYFNIYEYKLNTARLRRSFVVDNASGRTTRHLDNKDYFTFKTLTRHEEPKLDFLYTLTEDRNSIKHNPWNAVGFRKWEQNGNVEVYKVKRSDAYLYGGNNGDLSLITSWNGVEQIKVPRLSCKILRLTEEQKENTFKVFKGQKLKLIVNKIMQYVKLSHYEAYSNGIEWDAIFYKTTPPVPIILDETHRYLILRAETVLEWQHVIELSAITLPTQDAAGEIVISRDPPASVIQEATQKGKYKKFLLYVAKSSTSDPENFGLGFLEFQIRSYSNRKFIVIRARPQSQHLPNPDSKPPTAQKSSASDTHLYNPIVTQTQKPIESPNTAVYPITATSRLAVTPSSRDNTKAFSPDNTKETTKLEDEKELSGGVAQTDGKNYSIHKLGTGGQILLSYTSLTLESLGIEEEFRVFSMAKSVFEAFSPVSKKSKLLSFRRSKDKTKDLEYVAVSTAANYSYVNKIIQVDAPADKTTDNVVYFKEVDGYQTDGYPTPKPCMHVYNLKKEFKGMVMVEREGSDKIFKLKDDTVTSEGEKMLVSGLHRWAMQFVVRQYDKSKSDVFKYEEKSKMFTPTAQSKGI